MRATLHPSVWFRMRMLMLAHREFVIRDVLKGKEAL
jgi:hypothetical protein